MKINVYIFTFNLDRELVPMCVAGLRHAAAGLPDGDSAHVTVVDDANERAWQNEGDGLEATRADAYIVSDWPRCKNLNKSACVAGMLAMYDSAPSDCDWVMQVDSDILLRSFEHLRSETADIVGIGPYDILTNNHLNVVYDFVGGAAMAIRRTQVPVLREQLEREGFRARIDAGYGFSDRIICRLNAIAGGRMSAYWHDKTREVVPGMDFYEARLTEDNVESDYAARALVLHCDHRLCKKREDSVPIMRAAFARYFTPTAETGRRTCNTVAVLS